MAVGLQDDHADHDGEDAVVGVDHGQDEVNDIEDALGNVDAEEKRRAQRPPGAHDNADDVENQAEQDDDHDDAGNGQDGVVVEVCIVLVPQPLNIVLENPEAGNYQRVQANLDNHDDDADDPEGDQNSLQERRRVADDVGRRHGGWIAEMIEKSRSEGSATNSRVAGIVSLNVELRSSWFDAPRCRDATKSVAKRVISHY